MSGHLNGVAAQIQKEFPSALYVHCLAHCTNLCLQSVGRQCIPVRDALDLVMELSQLVRYSPKWSTLFQTLQSQLSPQSPSLKPLCPTRWTVRTAAISSVIENYAVLCEALAEINLSTHDQYGRKAGGFFAQMEKFSTFFGLKLSHLVFSGTEQLSISLQGKDTTVQESINAAELAVKFLERLRQESLFDEFYSGVVEASKELTSSPTLPRYRKPPTKPGDVSAASHEFATPQSYFRRQYYEALDLLTNELKCRFQQKRGLPVAAIIEKTMLAASGGSLEQVPDDFQIYKNDLDLQIQLQMLPDLIRSSNMKLTNYDIPIRKVTDV